MGCRNVGDYSEFFGVHRADKDVFTGILKHGLSVENRMRPQWFVQGRGHTLYNRYLDEFTSGRLDRVDIVYTKFVSSSRQVATVETLLKAGSDFADHSGPLTEMVLLGNLAVRAAKVIEIDPQTGDVTNTTIPEEYIKPTYREGWGW